MRIDLLMKRCKVDEYEVAARKREASVQKVYDACIADGMGVEKAKEVARDTRLALVQADTGRRLYALIVGSLRCGHDGD